MRGLTSTLDDTVEQLRGKLQAITVVEVSPHISPLPVQHICVHVATLLTTSGSRSRRLRMLIAVFKNPKEPQVKAPQGLEGVPTNETGS